MHWVKTLETFVNRNFCELEDSEIFALFWCFKVSQIWPKIAKLGKVEKNSLIWNSSRLHQTKSLPNWISETKKNSSKFHELINSTIKFNLSCFEHLSKVGSFLTVNICLLRSIYRSTKKQYNANFYLSSAINIFWLFLYLTVAYLYSVVQKI